MRLLIVGSDRVYAIENFYVKYLKEAGVPVSLFAAQPLFYDYYQKSILNKIIYRLGLSSILKKINRIFKERVEAERPDVIWIFKGMEIFPETLKWAKEKRICLVNYNPDNPFIFTGKGSGNKNIIEAISLYDLHLTYNLSVQQILETEYKMKTGLLPFGFDVSDELYRKCLQQKEVIKACFLGNPDNDRAAFIRSLAEAGVEIDVYGNHWKSFLSHPNVTVFDPVYGEELWLTLYKYRVQLNLMRVHNLDSHNMRSFEVPGVGGIMLAPDTAEHRMFFQEGKNVFLYKQVADCVSKLKELLSLPEAEANTIRKDARSFAILQGYTYKDRARQAYEQMKVLHG